MRRLAPGLLNDFRRFLGVAARGQNATGDAGGGDQIGSEAVGFDRPQQGRARARSLDCRIDRHPTQLPGWRVEPGSLVDCGTADHDSGIVKRCKMGGKLFRIAIESSGVEGEIGS